MKGPQSNPSTTKTPTKENQNKPDPNRSKLYKKKTKPTQR
jgi:hypothetical protein